MSDVNDVKFSLSVVLNKQKTKVLFAEADSHFTDVLFSFLTLPLGTIVRVLKKHYADQETPVNIGSLTSLYNGLENLDIGHFWNEGLKEILLCPRSSFESECCNLKLDISDPQPTVSFTCKSPSCVLFSTKISFLSVYYDTVKCVCGKTMAGEAGEKKAKAAEGGMVFTVNTESFIICDDLQIFPSTTGFIQTLGNLGIADADVGEPIIVTFGFSEIMDLLKGSLLSQTPLSNLILNKGNAVSATLKSEPVILSREMEKEATSNSEKMILKVILQKSTNKLLFAQAQEDFVNFLFSLMAIPLGEVECLLGSNTCLKSIDNLYRSVADLVDEEYLATPYTKNRLMKPKLPHGYVSGNPVLTLSQESVSHSLFAKTSKGYGYYVTLYSAKFLKGHGKYVRGPRMYKITDDLTVTPFSTALALSTLKGLKVPMSDVKELEFEIRLEEGLSILKASLTSTCALTKGLKINPILSKQPKQEH